MRTSTGVASSQAHRASHLGQLNHVLGEWWQQLRLRHELENPTTRCCAISACRAAKRGSRHQSTSG